MMKNVAIGILVVFLAVVLLQPIAEIANLTKEKVLLGTALTNAARSARDRSLEYEFMRNLDAKVDREKFVGYFTESFEDAMNFTCTNKGQSEDTLRFVSNDGRYNEFIVELDFTEEDDLETEQLVSKVEMTATTEYKFKTKYLQLAEAAGEDTATELKSKRSLILDVKN